MKRILWIVFIGIMFTVATAQNNATAADVVITGSFTSFSYPWPEYLAADSFLQFDNGNVLNPLDPSGTNTQTANQIDFWDSEPNAAHNMLSTTGVTISNPQKDTEYVIGYLNFYNGDWWAIGDTPSAWVNLNMRTTSSDTDFDGFEFSERIAFKTTPDDPNPYLTADLVYFENHPEWGSFRVYEDSLGIIEIQGRFGSLYPTGFGRVLTPETAYWNEGIGQTTVPEPASMLLLGSGLIGIVFYRRFKA